MEALIIACGALDRGDDAAGLLAAQRLRELGVDVRVHSRDGLALMESWQGWETVVLIDAVVGGRAPGSVTIWNATEAPVMEDVFRSSTHTFGVAEAVKLARALDRMPSRMWICGIEGRRFDLGSAPCAEVARAAEKLALRLAGEIW